jgi:hypothetical protein
MLNWPWQANVMAPIRVTFSLTRADILAGLRAQFRPWRYSLLIGGVLAVAMTIFALASSQGDLRALILGPLVGWVLGGALAFYRWAFTFPLSARTLARNNRSFYDDLSLVADESGVRVENARGLSTSRWDEIVGYHENRRVLVIMVARALMHIVPRACLTDEQLVALRSRMKRL